MANTYPHYKIYIWTGCQMILKNSTPSSSTFNTAEEVFTHLHDRPTHKQVFIAEYTAPYKSKLFTLKEFCRSSNANLPLKFLMDLFK